MCQGSGAAEPAGQAAGGGPAGGGASAPKRPRRKDPVVIATKEVVGRQVVVWSDEVMEWSKATIAQYSPDSQQHLIRFSERGTGSVKHEEKWVMLSKTRFQWMSKPSPSAAPNPTATGAPKGEDAVGYQVRIFWPGMAKWYQGKIEAYDPSTKEHTVKYRDGDVQRYKLRHEAVVYLDKATTTARARDSRPRSGSKEKDGKGRGKGGDGGSRAVAGTKRKESSADEDAGAAAKKGKKAGAVAAAKDSQRARNPTPPKKRKGASGRATAASTTSGSSDLDGGDEGDDEDEFEEGSSEEEESDVEEEEEEEEEGEDEEDSGAEEGEGPRRGRGRPAGSKSKSGARRPGGGSGAPSSAARRRPGGAPAPAPAPDGAPRRRGRPPGSGAGRRSGRGRPGRRDMAVPRLGRAEEEIIRAAGAAVVGARVAVFWADDDALYKGKLIQFDSYHKRHKVVYDDGEIEWVALPQETFWYLTPRTASGGADAPFRSAMAQLGATQEVGTPARRGPDVAAIQGTAAPAEAPATAAPPPEDAPGWVLSLRAPADGRWHRAEVLCHDAARGRHMVLYADGEDEWVSLAQEDVVWHRRVPAGRSGLFPGKAPGVDNPSGRDAVGWRVAVFWPGDQAFYQGEIAGWDDGTGQYEVSYDDGEEGTIKLSEDRIKWILPPGVAVDHEALERMEVGGGRPRRRVTAAGADSDPDYEFEQAAGFGGAGRGRRGGGGAGAFPPARRGRPPAAATAAAMAGMHGWGDSLGGEASDALPSPLAHPLRGSGSLLAAGAGGDAAAAAEGFIGDPVVNRTITRVPAFGSLSSGGEEARLPAAVTIKIYLSGSGGGGKEGAEAKASPAGEKPAASAKDAEVKAEPAEGGAPLADAEKPAATSSPAAPSPAVEAPRPLPEGPLPPAAKLQGRLETLDLMARRVGRAQQAIVKGVPTDLPAYVSRPLRLGPPPSVARLAAAGAPGAGGRGRPGGAPGGATHRLARPTAVSHSPYHRRSLDEEEDSEEEGGDDDDDATDAGSDEEGEDMEDDGADGREGGHMNGLGLASSSGSSDDEGGDGGSEGDAVMSPRSPTFPRGGKFKPSAAGGSGEPGPAPRDAAAAEALAESPMVTGIRPAVPPSPFMPSAPPLPAQDQPSGPSGRGDGMELDGRVGLPAADSVASLLTLPRNQSMGLLGEMPPGAQGGAAGRDYMDP